MTSKKRWMFARIFLFLTTNNYDTATKPYYTTSTYMQRAIVKHRHLPTN